MFYLVKYHTLDWSGDLDVYGLALLDEKDKEFFESIDTFPLVHILGDFHAVEFNKLTQFLSCYTWTPISIEDYQLLLGFIGKYYGNFYYPEKKKIERNQ